MTEITAQTRGSFRTEISTGSHTLIADEPVSAGGGGEGPNPYDLLAAALGACKAMTLQFYATREGFPLAGTDVKVTYERKHARDCDDCESQDGYIHEFRVTTRLEGDDLTTEQRDRLHSVASRCPVHKTLSSEIRIRDERS